MSTKDDIYFMNQALLEAKLALEEDEAPVGAVIVYGGKIISVGRNNRESAKNPLGHAEILAIEKASKYLSSWRLTDCTLYVTLEPCPMCAGAIISARVSRVVYGARDIKAGCFGSLIDLSKVGFNHIPLITTDVLSTECSSLLSLFFKKLR